nr:uncharacterized protein LOC112940683 [Solanum lycopersicum]
MASKIDHTYPLYLSSSDVTGAIQIGIQLVGMENYTLWSRAMDIKREDYTVDSEKKQWDRCNAMVLSWLMNNVSKELMSEILFRSNASLVWSDLKERFDKVNMSRIFHLHKSIVTHTQGTSPVSVYYSKLKDLWDEFDSIVPPPSCNCERSKEYVDSMLRQKLLQFLMGLNDNYSHARSQILMMNTPPTVNQCYAMIIQDESQRELSGYHYNLGGQMDPTALFTSRSGGNNFSGPSNRSGNVKFNKQRSGYLYCDHCDMKGHNRADCNKLKYCIHCHKHGHLKESCYQLIGYPTNYKGKRQANIMTTNYNPQFNNPGSSTNGNVVDQMQQFKSGGSYQMSQQYESNPSSSGSGAVLSQHFTPDQYQQVLQMMNKSLIHEGNTVSTNSSANTTGIFAGHSQFTPSTSSFDWIVDSGATDHMVRTKDLLTHGSTVKSSGNVQLPNGDSTKVTHSGCSQLQGGEVVKNVLYVPELNFNLLSVAKLTRQLNYCAIFYPDFFLLQDLFTGKVKEIGEEKGGLYILKSSQLIDNGQHRSFVAIKNSAEGELDRSDYHFLIAILEVHNVLI